MDTLLDRAELAQKLSVSDSTIKRLEKRGMPKIKLPTGSIRFDYSEVRGWLDKCNITGDAA